MRQRVPVVIDGVRYNPVEKRGCEGCAASPREPGIRTRACLKLGGALVSGCLDPSVIWLTDADYAVHRLTQGDPP